MHVVCYGGEGVYGGGKDEWEPVPLVVSIHLRRCLHT